MRRGSVVERRGSGCVEECYVPRAIVPFLFPWLHLSIYCVNDFFRGSVDFVIIERREIDGRGAFAGMPHGLADDTCGHVEPCGFRGPGVARDVGGQHDVRTDFRGQPLQVVVVGPQRVPIGGGGVILEDGEEVVAFRTLVLVDDVAHDFFHFHGK